ncbi:hypothetical protein MRB53_038675 [Persea americana]|nr:hypothetical protein MRB53_038675 [Persea americana]
MKRKKLAEEAREQLEAERQRIEQEHRKRIGLPTLPSKDDEKPDSGLADAASEDIADEELTKLLRALSVPVRLFGETHTQRSARYHTLTRAVTISLPPPSAQHPIPTMLEPVPEAEMKTAVKLRAVTDTAARLYLSRQLSSWFTLVLREWAYALAQRDEETKKSFTGQSATNDMTQAVSHLKPLFRKLEKWPQAASELPDDLFKPLLQIVQAAQERRYVDANDGYLQLSIGKAAWPIGVTQVGIHAR